jgi:hypothetical protein
MRAGRSTSTPEPVPEPATPSWRPDVDYKTVSKMTATQLREQLAKYSDLTGLSAMKKDKLVEVLCSKLGIDRHTHGDAGIDKTAIKQKIRTLKKERDTALAAKDAAKLAEIHHALHKQRHLLRRAVKLADLAAAHVKG